MVTTYRCQNGTRYENVTNFYWKLVPTYSDELVSDPSLCCYQQSGSPVHQLLSSWTENGTYRYNGSENGTYDVNGTYIGGT